MQFSTLALAALSSIAAVEAQSGTVKTISVEVGLNGTTFMPNNIKANVGDAVQFQFRGGNHTVTQSAFDKPCIPIQNSNPNITGVHSGYVPYAASAAMGMIPTYTIMINNTNPIWLYCAQGRHCQSGMVMVINENTNANSSRSLSNYRAAAASVAQASAPGGASGGQSGSGSGSGTGTGSGSGSGSCSGSGSGSGTGSGSGSGTGTGSNPSQTTTPTQAAGSMLSVPSTLALLAVFVSALFI